MRYRYYTFIEPFFSFLDYLCDFIENSGQDLIVLRAPEPSLTSIFSEDKCNNSQDQKCQAKSLGK